MTFDEAIDKILFDSFEDTHNYDVVYTEDVVSLIKKLKEEYAPTIEMTKEQLHVLNSYRETDLYDGDYEFYAFFNETCVPRLNSMRDTSLYGNLTEAQLMQAWVHHDDIQIIDKE